MATKRPKRYAQNLSLPANVAATDPEFRRILSEHFRAIQTELERLSGAQGAVEITGDLDLGGHRLTNVGPALEGGDLVTRSFADRRYLTPRAPAPAPAPEVRAEAAPPPPAGEIAAGPAPDVRLWKIGRANADGSFELVMYWDDTRQRMLIDFGCLLPFDTNNWSGFQVWIRTPAAGGGFNYVQATGLIPETSFRAAADGARFVYDNLAILKSDVPAVPESWRFIAASLNRNGQLNVDGDGNPRGPAFSLDTLVQADYVLDFFAQVNYHFTKDGEFFSLSGSWTNQPVPRYKGVQIWLRGFEAEPDKQLTGSIEGETAFATSPPWPVPGDPQAVTLHALPVYGDNTLGDIEASPSVPLTIERQTGTPGIERAPLATSLAAGTPVYVKNGDGQRVLRIPFTWATPAAARFGAIALWVIRPAATPWNFPVNHFQVTGPISGDHSVSAFNVDLTNFPAVSENTIWYALSLNPAMEPNTAVEGVTPAVSVVLPPPLDGPSGREKTEIVSNFVVSVQNPTTADGTFKAVVTVTFTKPADPTWGSLDIRQSTDGFTYKTLANGTSSPIVFEVTVPNFGEASNIAGVSRDVNGRPNNVVVGVTPIQGILVGSAFGQFDLAKAKATSYDANIFTFTSGAFTVWAMNGSLLVNGTIESGKLNTTAINVGGGGGKPGKFAVFNGSGQQIGFIGVEGGFEGGWFKTFRVGGTGASNAKLIADASGNVSLADATLSGTMNVGSGGVNVSGTGGIHITGGGGIDAPFAVLPLFSDTRCFGFMRSDSPFNHDGTFGLSFQVVTLAKLTEGGSNGSITISGGIVTAYTAPT